MTPPAPAPARSSRRGRLLAVLLLEATAALFIWISVARPAKIWEAGMSMGISQWLGERATGDLLIAFGMMLAVVGVTVARRPAEPAVPRS